MSYLEHIRRCNKFSVEGYIPFKLENKLIGWANQNFVEKLTKFTSVFNVTTTEFSFIDELNSAQLRTNAIAPINEQLHRTGIIESWVGETYAITNSFGDTPLFNMERAAVSYFGVRSYGVHINGLVQKSDGVYVWIARRTKDKPFWPGMLDQIVAGGQPAGISLIDNVIKESAEEANIPKKLAKKAKLVSELHYLGKNTLNRTPKDSVNDMLAIHSDTLFNYDLWLPEDFVPENTDGEVDEFMLMSLEELATITDSTDEFKNNCNLVNIDLLIRMGLINDSHLDFNQITDLLYAPARLE